MGGPFVMCAAAAFPDRIGAGATFHGGGLVTDKPDSPHLLIPQMKARFLIAIAENDDKRQPEAKVVLRDAFAKAHLAGGNRSLCRHLAWLVSAGLRRSITTTKPRRPGVAVLALFSGSLT